MNKFRRIFAALLAASISLSLVACSNNGDSVQVDVSAVASSSSMAEPEDPAIDFPEYGEQIAEKEAINSDTIGWIHVPGTNIDDVVVQKDDPNDLNNYYWHRNFNQVEYGISQIPNYSNENSWAYYADSRATLGDGTAESLPKNTVIYGHTVDTNIDANIQAHLNSGKKTEEFDGKRFAALKFFTDEEFARNTPYIYFSTGGEEMVWEVFAVFFPTVELPYNNPNFTANGYSQEEIMNEIRLNSIYDYDVDVDLETDKLLTLSTCTYYAPDTGYLGYPNNYRYVVMAKLVDRDTATKTEASFIGDEDDAEKTSADEKSAA